MKKPRRSGAEGMRSHRATDELPRRRASPPGHGQMRAAVSGRVRSYWSFEAPPTMLRAMRECVMMEVALGP